MNGKCLPGYFSAAQNYKRRFTTYLILYGRESIGIRTSANSPYGEAQPCSHGELGGRSSSLCPWSCSSCPPFHADNTGTWPSAMMAHPSLFSLRRGRFGMVLLFSSEMVQELLFLHSFTPPPPDSALPATILRQQG